MGLTWWQSLIIGSVPACIAAGAVLWQSRMSRDADQNRRDSERATHVADVEHERRLAAHIDALALLNRLLGEAMPYVTVAKDGRLELEQLEPDVRSSTEVFAMHARLIMTSTTDAAQAFWEAAGACDDLLTTIGRSGGAYRRAVGLDVPTAQDVITANTKAIAARNRYIARSHAELGILDPD